MIVSEIYRLYIIIRLSEFMQVYSYCYKSGRMSHGSLAHVQQSGSSSGELERWQVTRDRRSIVPEQHGV